MVRISSALFLILILTSGCNRGNQNKDAVRQAVVDHLAARQFNMATMDLQVASVQFNGAQADATVTFAPKGADASQGMSMQYHLEQQGNKWVVTGRKDSGSMPHGGGAMPPAAESPHGAPGSSRMPSPGDLPPAGTKK
jgi:hypothetical protein